MCSIPDLQLRFYTLGKQSSLVVTLVLLALVAVLVLVVVVSSSGSSSTSSSNTGSSNDSSDNNRCSNLLLLPILTSCCSPSIFDVTASFKSLFQKNNIVFSTFHGNLEVSSSNYIRVTKHDVAFK